MLKNLYTYIKFLTLYNSPMKKIFLGLILLIQFQYSHASHVAGADITYECQGNGIYKLTYTFYRDCFGIEAPLTVAVDINNSCGLPLINRILPLSTVIPIEVFPNCTTTTCDGGIIPGFQKCIYEDTITFPAQCQWTFSVTMSSRNYSLMSLVDPDLYQLYVEGSLNNLNNNCDTSPVFTSNPITMVCVNQPYCLDPGLMLANQSDSVSCSLVAALTAPNQPVTYIPGYSFSQPLISTPPVTINNTNGMLCFTSTQPDVGVYAIQVSTFRNGTLIGTVERDMIIYTLNCTTSQPLISGINGDSFYDVHTCAHIPLCFSIYSNDSLLTDSVNLSWDNNIPGADFIITDTQQDSASFCWTPSAADIDSIPHCFTVFARDNGCPFYQTNSKTFCVTVRDCLNLNHENVTTIDRNLKIYPQPASEYLIIECGELNFNKKDYTLCITDVLGNILFQSELISQKTEIEIDRFIPAMYLAFVIDRDGNFVRRSKFIVGK
jgi:hypothetical protein